MQLLSDVCKIILLHIILICFSLPICALADNKPSDKLETYRQLEIFSNVLSLLEENYVEEISTKEVLTGAISGLLFSLDPHSSYLSPENFKELQEDTRGTFSGIGIELTIKNDRLTVISPIADTPADRAGLKANDIIVEIEGEKSQKLGPLEAIKKLRGPTGSKVRISIHRKGWDELKEITLTREVIPMQSVKADFLSPGFIYTRITNFQNQTTKDFKVKFNELKKKNPIHGVILDLRNNPGGLLPQAVNIADIFLDKGIIVYTKGRREDQNFVYTAEDLGEKNNFPLVLLVNEGSASASEIVAGAIQAHQRGILVGTRTFGKGSVQQIIPLPDGAGLRMTTARYYTPDDRSIQALGIQPDVVVPFVACTESSSETKKRKIRKESNLANHLPGTKVQKDKKDPATNTRVLKMLQTDNQLRSAYNILKSLALYSKFRKE